MYNNNEKISASEVNKYCFCEYSWYYERLYGQKHIREKYKNKSEKKEFSYATINNFKRGIEFHDSFLEKRKKIVIIKSIILTITIILILGVLKICGIL